jgi:hypothetical protein
LARFGTNHYGEPIFKLVWSQEPRHVIGGLWARDGYVGYREVPSIPGHPCWALMGWEPASKQGSYATWEMENADETGLSQIGGFPHYGRYRLLKRFLHQEVISKPCYRQMWNPMTQRFDVETSGMLEVVTHRMEPNGFMLDLLIPLLAGWLKLSNEEKVAILKEEEQAAKDEFTRRVKDARDGQRIGIGSQMVQKRAELIEKGFEVAMRMAAQTRLGMRIGE